MSKRVILITGTPCTGKTSISHQLATTLDALYLNLTDLAKHENLTLGKDKKRNSIIVDEQRMQRRINQIIKKSHKENIIIDGHYAATVVPKKLITRIFVLRRDPIELCRLMKRSGFSDHKLFENLASEILDVCLVDALNTVGARKVCELNVTRKSVKKTINEIMFLLDNPTSEEALSMFIMIFTPIVLFHSLIQTP